MAEIKVYPVNGVDYDAEDVETYMATRTSGVWAGDLDYTCKVTGLDNNVTVSDGLAWMRMSRFSGKSVAHKGTTVLDAGLPDPRLPRLDAVVLQYRAGDPTGKLFIKKGTPASDPQPPKVERSASLYELHLFHIKRRVGATTIAPSDLTDLREDEKYCGIMYNDVTLKGTLGFLTQKDRGAADGVASLVNGEVPFGQLPELDDQGQVLEQNLKNVIVSAGKDTIGVSCDTIDISYVRYIRFCKICDLGILYFHINATSSQHGEAQLLFDNLPVNVGGSGASTGYYSAVAVGTQKGQVQKTVIGYHPNRIGIIIPLDSGLKEVYGVAFFPLSLKK